MSSSSSSSSFVSGVLDEIRDKPGETPHLKKLSAKCEKSVLGDLIESAATRGDALDDVLKAVFDRIPAGGSGGGSGSDGGGSGNDDVDEDDAADKRLFVFRKGIELIQRAGLLTCRSAGDLVTLLTFQLDNFPVESLFELVEDFLAKIKTADISNEESIELFPKVLSCLAAKPNLTTEQGESESVARDIAK